MTKLQCIILIRFHWPWRRMFAMKLRKVFDIIIIFFYNVMDFDILLNVNVKGPWAKVARRYHTLLPLAGVGNTPTRRRKDICHIFSVELLHTVTLNLTLSVLHCIAKEKKKRIIAFLSSLLLLLSCLSSQITPIKTLTIYNLEPIYKLT